MPITERTKKGTNAKHKVDEKDIAYARRMIGFGLTHAQVAKVLGVADRTFDRHYAPYLKDCKAYTDAKAYETLWRIMSDTNHPKAITAAIFYLKARCGWREVQDVNLNVDTRKVVKERVDEWLSRN